MSNTRDSKILEALLFASGSPISEEDLKEKIINKKEFKKIIEKLKEFYNDRKLLVEVGKTGHDFVQKHHNPVESAKKVVKQYESILS